MTTDAMQHEDPGIQLGRTEYGDIHVHTLGPDMRQGDMPVAKPDGTLRRLPMPPTPGKMLTSGESEPDYEQRQLNQHVHVADGQEIRVGSAEEQRAWMKSTNGVFEHHGFPWLTEDDLDDTDDGQGDVTPLSLASGYNTPLTYYAGIRVLGIVDTGITVPETDDVTYVFEFNPLPDDDTDFVAGRTAAGVINNGTFSEFAGVYNNRFSVATAAAFRNLDPIVPLAAGQHSQPALYGLVGFPGPNTRIADPDSYIPHSADSSWINGIQVVLCRDANRRIYFAATSRSSSNTALARAGSWRLHKLTAQRGRRGVRGLPGPAPSLEGFEFRIENNDLQWRLDEEDDWNDLGPVAGILHGDDGRDAYSSRINGFSWSNGTFGADTGNRFDDSENNRLHVAATAAADQLLLGSLIRGTKISLRNATNNNEVRNFTLTADAAAHSSGDAGEYTLSVTEEGADALSGAATYNMLITQARPGIAHVSPSVADVSDQAGLDAAVGEGIRFARITADFGSFADGQTYLRFNNSWVLIAVRVGGSTEIPNGSITGDKLARFAVSEQEKIQSGVIIERHFADGAIPKRAMRHNSVGREQIEQDAVTDGELAANSVGESELKDAILALLLPTLPAMGSRDNKVPKFEGNILGWEPDSGGATTQEIAAAVNAYLTANPPAAVPDNSLTPIKTLAGTLAQRAMWRERFDSSHIGYGTALPAIAGYNESDIFFVTQDSSGANFVDLSAPSVVLTDAKSFDVMQVFNVRGTPTWTRLGNIRAGSSVAQSNQERINELDDLTADMEVERKEVWTLATDAQGGITTVETSEAALIAKMRAGTLDPSADLGSKVWANNVNIAEPNGRYLILRTDADESENDFGIRFNDEDNYRHFYPYWFAVAQGDYRYHIWRTSSAPEDIRTTGGRVRLYHRSSEAHNTYHGALAGGALTQINAVDLARATVIKVSPPFTAGETLAQGASRNVYFSIQHPANAYAGANTVAIEIQGTTLYDDYNPAEIEQTVEFGLTRTILDNIASNGLLVVGNFIDVNVSFQTGTNAASSVFTRRVRVPVVAAQDYDLRAVGSQAATPVAGDRWFFTDENQPNDPIRHIQHRDLPAALGIKTPFETPIGTSPATLPEGTRRVEGIIKIVDDGNSFYYPFAVRVSKLTTASRLYGYDTHNASANPTSTTVGVNMAYDASTRQLTYSIQVLSGVTSYEIDSMDAIGEA